MNFRKTEQQNSKIVEKWHFYLKMFHTEFTPNVFPMLHLIYPISDFSCLSSLFDEPSSQLFE